MLARCCKHLCRRFEPRYINPSSAVKKHNCAGVSIRLLLTSSDGSSKKSESVLPDASVVKPTAGDDDDADMSADEFEPDVKTDISKITSSALGDNDEEFDGDEDNEARRLYYEQKVSGVEAPRAPRIQAAYVPLREKLIDDQGRSYGTGKRKTSIARVWIKEGSGLFIVNDKRLIDYFTSMHREYCLESFMASKTAGLFDVWCTVKGGGTSGDDE